MHRLGNAALINLRSVMVQKYPCAENRILVTSYEYQYKPILTIFGRSPIGNSACVRAQSSTPTAESSFLKKRKRRRFRDSRFVELLQVTDSATKQITTKVQNLKSQNLSNFVLNSDLPPSKRSENSQKSKKKGLKQPIEYQKINLEMFDTCTMQTGAYDERPMIFVGKNGNYVEETKVDEILQSFHNFKEIIDSIKDEYQDENTYCESKVLDDKLDEELCDPIEDIQHKETSTTDVSFTKSYSKQKSQKFKSKNYTTEANEKMAKHKSLMINLTAYLNVCISVGSVQRGSNTLLYYRDKYKKLGYNPNSIGIEPYNIILHGYAATGKFDKMYGLCKIIKADEIPFNCQTFAALFECLGRTEPSEGNDNLIRKYINNAESMNINLNDILDKSKFQYDQREIVLDAIRRIEPEFSPIYTPPDLTYCNPLLENLNKFVKDFKCEDDSDVTENRGNEIMNSKRGFTKTQLQEFAKEEIKKELDGYLAVKSVEKQQTADEPTSTIYKTKFEELQKTWQTQICAAINRNLNILRAQNRYKPQEVMTYYIYLKTLSPSQYADIILREIRILAEGSETYSPALSQLYRELGEKVYAKYQIEHKKNNGTLNKIGEIYSEYCDQWEKSITSDNSRQIWQRLLHENQSWGPSMDLNESVWPRNVLYNIGRFLYNIMMRDIKIDANVTRTQGKIKSQNRLPAFYTVFRNQGKTVKEEIKPHPILSRLLRLSQQNNLFFDASLVPMLCPPQPWTTPVNGGYLLKNSELIRLPSQAVQQWSRINESDSRQLYPALDSLNQLGSIAWRVNTDVLDVILEVFRNGGDEKLDVPKPPSSLPPLQSISYKDAALSNAERYQIFKDKLIRRRKQGEMYSLWCDTLYRLSLANHYRDKVFWLPHNMDFRGRVYPIPPHLNHLGSDLARSMLVFDQAQPLGVDGFSWLKLHCINLTGLKKRDSIRERLLYAEEKMDDIIDSAEHPLTGRMWWTKSDEPWQTLSCCIEIAKVAKCPEPEKYMCHLPIHQDGSCNGLQHYAALGRDTAGAFSVNLASAAVPQDVYSSVAALVEKSRETDADNGLHVAQILKGYVRRKVIKQTVMTTVYGVTKHGARLQIAKQLKDIDEFPKDWVWPASAYLTTKTFESLREMFTSTKEIQDWFTECARLISSVCSENVEWITPLGLPVVQPYSRFDSRGQFDKTGSRIKEHFHMDMFTKPNVMKQKNAFPPNFIHSLDSSHMMLTSLFCERKGITFVSVHDCFWTHACTVPDMNKICREQFVALHSQTILEDLSKFLVQKYSFIEKDFGGSKKSLDISKQKLNKLLQKVPQKGDFDLKKVLESVYFFS